MKRYLRKQHAGSLPVPQGSVVAVSFQDEVDDVDAVPTLVSKRLYDDIKA